MFMKKLISSMLIVAMLASSAAVMVNAEETTNPNITAQEVQDEKDIEITVEGKVLTKDVDYTLTYKDNVNAGTATVIINFIGNYSGSKDATFEIKKKSSSGGSHGSSKSPENVSVEDKNNNKITVSVKNNGDTKVITLPSNKTISDDDSYTIIITDKDKKPIPNKKVEVVDKKGNKAEGVTDENGKLVLPQTIPSPTPETSPIPTMTPDPEYEHKAYISGYDNGNFKPDGNITRAETASMLYRVLDTESDNEKLTFSIHPDDPPFQVLGLPRIVTGEEDINWLLHAVDNPHNGLTFCAGSLSAGLHNNVPLLARMFAHRTHFVHLRSTNAFPNGNFIEASHLGGRAHVIELIRIFEKERPGVPMRVDHGRMMLDDAGKGYNPGYSFHGRMMALAQIEGMMAVINEESKLKS